LDVRLFSQHQKRHLYMVQSGLCAQCGGDLGPEWDAHHLRPYADSGITELTNGVALCKSCHQMIHRGISMIEPRGWQVKACKKEQFNAKKEFLLNATPGAGKTIFSGLTAKRWLDDGVADFIVAVVPTTALKGDSRAGFLGDWAKVGIDIKTIIKEGRGVPREFQGAVITYQQLPNMVETLKVWARNGTRIGFVFDEIHHASERNIWGAAVSACHSIGSKVLGMTGTPFRGDGARISFVHYSPEGVAVADFDYSYRDAIRDTVCREVDFMTDDGIAEYAINESQEQVRISEATPDQEGKVKAAVFHKDSTWLEATIIKADEKLDEYRTFDAKAGGLIICRPGNDDDDDRHLEAVAKVVKRVTGETPVVITHDDKDANAKIEAFRNGTTKWICSVRKISEGVDVKRLRVLLLATVPGTELLFRQLIGRVVRQKSRDKTETATVFMAKFPQITQWASEIMAEAKAGLTEQRKRKESEKTEDGASSGFVALGSTHEDGGAISVHGEMFSSIDIKTAEKIKSGDRELATTSVTAIAHLLKKIGYASDHEPEVDPLEIRKRSVRREINTLVRRIALRWQQERNMDKPAFAMVWSAVHRQIGVTSLDDLMDNHPIDKAMVVVDLLKQYLAGAESDAA